jgi:uncharacterized membrane protein YjgN (DUF898 family)
MTRREEQSPCTAAVRRCRPPAVRRLPLEFVGSASAYFRVWIVNLCLSLLTLGLYSPWAKVRNKQHLYGRMRLDGTPFRYLAPPLAILKGRLIAAVLITGFYAVTHLYLSLRWYAVLIAAVGLPWVLVRASVFDAHYSAFRNLRFAFRGTYLGAFTNLGVAAIQAVTVVGLPWAYCRVKNYFVGHLCFGGVRARLHCLGNRLFVPFLLALGIGLVCLVVVVAGLGWIYGREREFADWMLPAFLVPLYFGYALAYSLLQARALNLLWRRTSLGPLYFQPRYRARDLLLLYVTNTVAVVASLGLLVPWAAVRLLRYRTERLVVFADRGWDAFSASGAAPARVPGALADSLASTLELGS